MRALLATEFYKLIKQSRTYYALAAIFVIEGVVLFSAYYQGAGIIDIVLSNLKDSFYFEGNLLNGNLVTYFILNSLWFHVPLILIIIMSGSLTTEYKDKTLQTVMMQPVKKWQYILSKYIVAIVFTTCVVFVLALTSFLLSYALFGKGDLIVYVNGLTFFEHDDALLRLVYAFIVGAVSMVFFSVVSVTLAVIFKEAMKTWIIAAFFLILSNILLKVDFGSELLNQLLYVKLNDTWQYFFTFEIPWSTIYTNVALLIVYTLLTMGVGVYVFQKKDIG